MKILEAELCPDHVHMLVEIPPKMSVSSFVGYLKGESSLMIHESMETSIVDMEIEASGVVDITLIPLGKMQRRFKNISKINLKKTKYTTR